MRFCDTCQKIDCRNPNHVPLDELLPALAELQEQCARADREDAPLLALQSLERDLEDAGLLDPESGESLELEPDEDGFVVKVCSTVPPSNSSL